MSLQHKTVLYEKSKRVINYYNGQLIQLLCHLSNLMFPIKQNKCMKSLKYLLISLLKGYPTLQCCYQFRKFVLNVLNFLTKVSLSCVTKAVDILHCNLLSMQEIFSAFMLRKCVSLLGNFFYRHIMPLMNYLVH